MVTTLVPLFLLLVVFFVLFFFRIFVFLFYLFIFFVFYFFLLFRFNIFAFIYLFFLILSASSVSTSPSSSSSFTQCRLQLSFRCISWHSMSIYNIFFLVSLYYPHPSPIHVTCVNLTRVFSLSASYFLTKHIVLRSKSIFGNYTQVALTDEWRDCVMRNIHVTQTIRCSQQQKS